MENKPFESILNYLKDENVISKKEFDYHRTLSTIVH